MTSLNKGQMADAIITSPLTGTQKLLLFAYMKCADNTTGLGFPGLKTLSEMADVGRATAQRHRAPLLEWGVLVVKGFTARGGMICQMNIGALPTAEQVQAWQDSLTEERRRKRSVSQQKPADPAHDEHPAHSDNSAHGETGTLLTVSIPPAHDEHRTTLTELSSIEPSSIEPSSIEPSSILCGEPKRDPVEDAWTVFNQTRQEVWPQTRSLSWGLWGKRFKAAIRFACQPDAPGAPDLLEAEGISRLLSAWTHALTSDEEQWWRDNRGPRKLHESFLYTKNLAGFLDRSAVPAPDHDAPLNAEAAWARILTALQTRHAHKNPVDKITADPQHWHLYADDSRVNTALLTALTRATETEHHGWAWLNLLRASPQFNYPKIRRRFLAAWPDAWAAVRDAPALDCKTGAPAGEARVAS